MSWNFILLIFINKVLYAMNRHCIPGLTMSTVLTGNFSAGVTKYQNDAHRVCARTRIALCQRPGADTEETDVMI